MWRLFIPTIVFVVLSAIPEYEEADDAENGMNLRARPSLEVPVKKTPKKSKKKHGIGHEKNGMQMGTSGFGLAHGYDDDDERDEDNSHEFKGGRT